MQVQKMRLGSDRYSYIIKIAPHMHMLRHTYATELVKSGVDATLLQKKLSHTSIQTAIDTYTHVDQGTMKQAIKMYWSKKEARRHIRHISEKCIHKWRSI